MTRSQSKIKYSGLSSTTLVPTPQGPFTLNDINEKVNEGQDVYVLSVKSNTLNTEWVKVAKSDLKQNIDVATSTLGALYTQAENTLTYASNQTFIILKDRDISTVVGRDVHYHNATCTFEMTDPDEEFWPALDLDESYFSTEVAQAVGALFSDGWVYVEKIDIDPSWFCRNIFIFFQKAEPKRQPFVDKVKEVVKVGFGLDTCYENVHDRTQVIGTNIGKPYTYKYHQIYWRDSEALKALQYIRKNFPQYCMRLSLKAGRGLLIFYSDGDGTFDDRTTGQRQSQCVSIAILLAEHKARNLPVLKGLIILCQRLRYRYSVTWSHTDSGENAELNIFSGVEDIMRGSLRLRYGLNLKFYPPSRLLSTHGLFKDRVAEVPTEEATVHDALQSGVRGISNRSCLRTIGNVMKKLPSASDLLQGLQRVLASYLHSFSIAPVPPNEGPAKSDVVLLRLESDDPVPNYIVYSVQFSPVIVGAAIDYVVSTILLGRLWFFVLKRKREN